MEFEFMTADIVLPSCMPLPTAMLRLPISSTAKVMYARLLDATLMEGAEDTNGILFVRFPIVELAAALSRSSVTVKRSLKELEDAGLKRTLYPPRESNRDKLCAVIDNILLNENPVDFEIFLQKLEQQGYEIKRGKHTSVKGARQKRFIRFRTLGAGYSEDEIKAVIAGEAERRPHSEAAAKRAAISPVSGHSGKTLRGQRRRLRTVGKTL